MRGLKLLSMAMAATIALTAAVASAQRDAGAKMRGEFGTGFQNNTGAAWVYGYRAAPMYRTPAPMVVRRVPSAIAPAAPAAPQLAQTPTERRAFSVEPNAIAVPPQGATVRRSFSYEPAPAYTSGAPTYRRGTAKTPSYLLLKTERGKFGG
jgi:hypothetical protein